MYITVEKGAALTPDMLRLMYKDLYQKYWGPAMVLMKKRSIPGPAYLISIIIFMYSSMQPVMLQVKYLLIKLKTKDHSAVEKYLNFLKSGNSDYSIKYLQAAGVDMNSPEPCCCNNS
jgi:oligoendopeptidase F